MNITLKCIKYMAALSEETHCFSADVYADGKKQFGMKNAGHGGDDEVYSVKGGVPDIWAAYKAIDVELAKEPHEQSENVKALGLPEMPNCLDYVVCDIINDYLQDKEIKKSKLLLLVVKKLLNLELIWI